MTGALLFILHERSSFGLVRKPQFNLNLRFVVFRVFRGRVLSLHELARNLGATALSQRRSAGLAAVPAGAFGAVVAAECADASGP